MSVKFKKSLCVLLSFLITQTFCSEFDKSTIVDDPENVDEKGKMKQDELQALTLPKRYIHDENTKLTQEQKNIVNTGVYPTVAQYCHSKAITITRFITTFL